MRRAVGPGLANVEVAVAVGVARDIQDAARISVGIGHDDVGQRLVAGVLDGDPIGDQLARSIRHLARGRGLDDVQRRIVDQRCGGTGRSLAGLIADRSRGVVDVVIATGHAAAIKIGLSDGILFGQQGVDLPRSQSADVGIQVGQRIGDGYVGQRDVSGVGDGD